MNNPWQVVTVEKNEKKCPRADRTMAAGSPVEM
jgi:hypothetical protein